MPPASFRHRAETRAPLAVVWERLQDPSTWAAVSGVDGTRDHTFDGVNLTGFGFEATVAGVPYRGTARVVESDPARRMTLSIRSNELQGTILADLTGSETGTLIEMTMSMRPAGFLGPMVFPVVIRAVEAGFPDSVERLAAALTSSH